MRRFYYFCLMVWLPYSALGNTASSFNVEVAMRDSGYHLGDFIHQTITFTLPKHTALDEESLPLTGYVKPWLDLSTLSYKQQGDTVQLFLTWQIFATVEIAQALKTPALVLKTKAKPAQEIVIPAQAFYYSPVFPYPLAETTRQNDLPPLAFNTQTPLIGLIVFSTLGVLLTLGWMWLKDWLPWPKNPGPIAKLAKSMRHNTVQTIDAKAFQAIYHALNASAGESLFPSNLSQLFNQAPYLLPYQTEVEQCFAVCWRAIYGDQPLSLSQGTASAEFTLDWIAQAAIAERLFLRKAAPLPTQHALILK
jgi:mxaA protein